MRLSRKVELELSPAPARRFRYAAFISYSRAGDGRLAPALQASLHSFAKPWYRIRALRTFRDDASLTVNPSLWASIANALDVAEFFILLASPESSSSTYVNKELDHWLASNPASKVLIAVTGGTDWDRPAFDWKDSEALPPALRGKLVDEPRYTDLRWCEPNTSSRAATCASSTAWQILRRRCTIVPKMTSSARTSVSIAGRCC